MVGVWTWSCLISYLIRALSSNSTFYLLKEINWSRRWQSWFYFSVSNCWQSRFWADWSSGEKLSSVVKSIWVSIINQDQLLWRNKMSPVLFLLKILLNRFLQPWIRTKGTKKINSKQNDFSNQNGNVRRTTGMIFDRSVVGQFWGSQEN